MNDKVFQVWQKKREQGFFPWLYKSTLAAVIFYVVFNIAFQYSAFSQMGALPFFKSQLENYGLFAVMMLIANGALWLYRESSYKKEVSRRNIG
ncbi:hypothetical protein [Vibrio rarus]|uniref:hypothetical protein n=1 Tax=Vibrio rarus TaxID=413403 RepID=UPI0021C40127|nr:hypothetical protein [Vibrio rarus]